MVSEVILHIGMHKTGSTSIQTALSGYDTGRAFYARFPESNHSPAIRGTFSTRPETYHQWQKLGRESAEIQVRCKQYRGKAGGQGKPGVLFHASKTRVKVKPGSGLVTCILRADGIIQIRAYAHRKLEFFEMMVVCQLLAMEIAIRLGNDKVRQW